MNKYPLSGYQHCEEFGHGVRAFYSLSKFEATGRDYVSSYSIKGPSSGISTGDYTTIEETYLKICSQLDRGFNRITLHNGQTQMSREVAESAKQAAYHVMSLTT